MLDRYGTPRAFRQALEARLMAQSKTTGVDLGRLRRQVVFDAKSSSNASLPD
jgi:hypothetical protein